MARAVLLGASGTDRIRAEEMSDIPHASHVDTVLHKRPSREVCITLCYTNPRPMLTLCYTNPRPECYTNPRPYDTVLHKPQFPPKYVFASFAKVRRAAFRNSASLSFKSAS